MRGRLFDQVIIVILVFQMIVGTGEFVWGQIGSGTKGGGGKAGSASKDVSGGKGGLGGVQSAETATETLPGGQALSQAVVRDKYTLGPGDGLSINIWGDYEQAFDVNVTPEGKVILPSLGDVEVNRLTLPEAEARITNVVKRYYRTVYASVSLKALRVFQVHVLGEVHRPGMYLATPVRRVSELIEKAGGVLLNGSSRNIELRRAGQVQARADLYSFLHQGDESMNPLLRDGDVIFVPRMGEARVVAYVTEVETGGGIGGGALTENSVPYAVEIKEGDRLSAVIDQVGGVNPWWDLEGLFIVREWASPAGTMRIPVDLRSQQPGREEVRNPVMVPGDQVYVPALIRRVYVTGMVKVPGAYTYMPNRAAEAYVGQAGGVLFTGDLARSYIQRADGTTQPYASAVELNNGDTIVVREKIFKDYQDYFAVFGAISSIILSVVGMGALFGFRFGQ